MTCSFSYLEPVCSFVSSSNCCFLTCIQVSQEAGQVVWYSHLFQNFPQFIAHVDRLEFPRETGLILRCAGKAGNPFQTTQGNRLSCRDQEGRRGSEEAVPGPSVFPSGEPGVSGDFWGSQEGCQGPFRLSGRNRGLPFIRRRGQGRHLAKTWEPRGFSRLAADSCMKLSQCERVMVFYFLLKFLNFYSKCVLFIEF